MSKKNSLKAIFKTNDISERHEMNHLKEAFSRRQIRALVVCVLACVLFLNSIPYTASAASEADTSVCLYTAEELVNLAKAQYGKAYEPNKSGPNTFDCTGFAAYLFKQFGISISNNPANYSSKNLSKYGVKIEISDLKPGDVVVYGTSDSAIKHVGIYIGDGIMINAMNKTAGVKYCFIGRSQYKAYPVKEKNEKKAVVIDGKTYELQYWSSYKLLYGVRIYGQQFSSITYKNPVKEIKSVSPVMLYVSAEETVTYGSATLKRDTDYTVSYKATAYELKENNSSVTVLVTITGKGHYQGVVFEREYTVDQTTYNKMLSGYTADMDGSLTAPGSKPAPTAQTPAVPDETAPLTPTPSETAPSTPTPATPAETTPAEPTPSETAPATPENTSPQEQTPPSTNEAEDPSVAPALSEDTWNDSTLTLRHAILPSGTLAEGRAFTISGQICSEYLIRFVSIGVYDAAGNQQFGIEKNVCRHVFSLYSVDSVMAFSSLKAGDYTYTIKVRDFISEKTWSGSFSVRASDVIGSDCTYPKGTLEEGKTFSCKGTVSSGSKLSEVTMSVYSVTGVKQFAASAIPDGKSFDLHTLDSEMTFRTLSPGKYIYRVAVRDANDITSYIITYSFEIHGDELPRVYAETGALSLLGKTYEELSYLVNDLTYSYTIDEDVWYAWGHYSEYGDAAYCQFTFFDTAPGDPKGTVSVVWFNDTEDRAMQIAGDVYTTMLYSNLWDIEGLSEMTYVGRWEIKEEYVEGLTASYRPMEDVKIDLCFRGEEVTESAPIYAACISIDEAYEPGETAADADTDDDSTNKTEPETPSDTPTESTSEPEPQSETKPGPYQPKETKKKVKVGDHLEFGIFEQDNNDANGAEALSWRVLYVTSDKTKALLISDYSLENIQFDEYGENQTWSASTLRAWLNQTFFTSAFSSTEQNALCAVSSGNTFLFTDASPDSADWVFCLSQSDAETLFSGNADRQAKNSLFAEAQMKQKMLTSWFYPNTMAEVEAKVAGWNSTYGENCSWWWLKDPAGAAVNAAGEISAPVDRRDLNSVRPAIWVDLTKLN